MKKSLPISPPCFHISIVSHIFKKQLAGFYKDIIKNQYLNQKQNQLLGNPEKKIKVQNHGAEICIT